MPAHGDVETLIALVRQRAPHAWRGRLKTADDVYEREPAEAAPRARISPRRLVMLVLVACAIAGFLIAVLLMVTEPSVRRDRDRTIPAADASAPRQR